MKVWKIVFHSILEIFHSIPFWHHPYFILKFLFHSIPSPDRRAGHPLPLFGKKSSGAAAYCYLHEKVATLPLPLLAHKTAAAANCCSLYFKKINSKKNDGIQMQYLMVKFQLVYKSYLFKLLKYPYRLQSVLAGLNGA